MNISATLYCLAQLVPAYYFVGGAPGGITIADAISTVVLGHAEWSVTKQVGLRAVQESYTEQKGGQQSGSGDQRSGGGDR